MLSIKPAARELLQRTFKAHPSILIAMAIMVVVGAMLEGAGMSLLLPIIEGLQDPAYFAPTDPISQSVAAVLSWFSVPLTLWLLFVICISLLCLQAGVKYFRAVLAGRIGSNILLEMRGRLFKAILNCRLAYLHQKKLGELVNAFLVEADRGRASFQHLMNMLVEAAIASAYLVVVLYLSWKLSLIVLLFLVVSAWVSKKRQMIYQQGTKLTSASDRLGGIVTESITGMREIKLFGRETEVENTFGKVSGAAGEATFELTKLNSLFNSAYDLTGILLLFIVVGCGWLLLGLKGSAIIVFLGVMFRLIPRVNSIHISADTYMGTIAGVEAVQKIIAEISDKSEILMAGGQPPIFKKQLEFKNVSFSYEGSNRPALQNMSFQLECGQTLAVIGASGAGKSTFADLVTRFYEPTEGAVFVDGVDLKGLDFKIWRSMIGFVSQENFLFNDTIANNIRFGDAQASDAEVVRVSKAVHAHEFISQMPEGYQTIVGDRGIMLSGGQRQRLSLARAILRDPQILILDEATSDLDSKSEYLIEQSLAEVRKNRTLIIVAHRLATIEKADKIIVLQDGILVEQGKHEALLHSGRYYAEFYNLQFRKADYLHQ